MFKGHEFIKLLDNNWVLDLTEYTGYKVRTDDNGNVISYKPAFEVEVMGEDIQFTKLIRLPLKVLKEASNVIRANINELEEDS